MTTHCIGGSDYLQYTKNATQLYCWFSFLGRSLSCSAKKLIFWRSRFFFRRWLYIDLCVRHILCLIHTRHAQTMLLTGNTKCRDIRMLSLSSCLCRSLFGRPSEEFIYLFRRSLPNGHMHTVRVIRCHGDIVWQHSLHRMTIASSNQLV